MPPAVSSDWNASAYDRVSDPQALWAEAVIDRLEVTGPVSILDAGCGSGRVTQLLLERFPEATVTGVDASPAMIDQARRRLEPFGARIRLIVGDLTEPIDVAEPVDAVFSNAVFHWVADHETLFARLADAMRPGAVLSAQWGGAGNIASLLDALEDVGGAAPMRPNFASTGETALRLVDAGFAEVRTWSHAAPADFSTDAAFEEYLETVCLRCHLDLLEPADREGFVQRVAERLPGRRIDYVRLNATARRA